jgi:hypothetical protein
MSYKREGNAVSYKVERKTLELMKGDPIIIAVAQQAPAPHHRQLL